MDQQAISKPVLLFKIDSFPYLYQEIRETIHPIDWQMNYHQHEFFQLVLIKQGAVHLYADKSYYLGHDQMAFIPPKAPHKWVNGSPSLLDLINVAIPAANVCDYELDGIIRWYCPNQWNVGVRSLCTELSPCVNAIVQEARKCKSGYKHYIASVVTQLLVTMIRIDIDQHPGNVSVSGQVSKISEALQYIESNYDRSITLDDISNSICVCRKYCCELFTRELGLSPMRYLQKVRLYKAKRLLADPSLRISEVAYMVGIADEAYFSRLFRKATHLTPSDFRAQHIQASSGRIY